MHWDIDRSMDTTFRVTVTRAESSSAYIVLMIDIMLRMMFDVIIIVACHAQQGGIHPIRELEGLVDGYMVGNTW